LNSRTLPRFALAAILLWAAFLRFWNLDATEFKYDEARVSNLAAHFVDTGIPPVRGMGSSIGVDNPPLTIYIMSLPILLSRDPLVATGFVALLNVVAVWGCYGLGRRYWSTEVGLLSAVLLAVSPWAVFYSRKIWAQNLLLPGIILFYGFLLAWLLDHRPWALSGAIVTLAALTQIHFSTLAFIPVLLVVLGLRFLSPFFSARASARTEIPSMSVPWKPLAAGVGLSALLYAPYFVFDALAGWRNVRAFVNLMHTPTQTRWESVNYALLNIGGRQIHALAGPEQFRHFLGSIVDLAYWPDRLQEAAVVASLVYLAYRWWRQRGDLQIRQRDGLLLLWLLAPSLSYLRAKSEVFPHYLIPLYPAPYLALAIAVVDLIRSLRRRFSQSRWLCTAGACLLGVLVVWQSYLSLSIYAFVEQHHTPGGMGTPIRIYNQVMHTMRQNADASGNSQVVVLCQGDDPRSAECPAVFQFLTSRDLDLRLADKNASLLFPQSERDTLVVLTPGESIAGEALPNHAERLVGQRVALRENVGAYTFYRIPAAYAPQPPQQPLGTPVRLANGVSLLGYQIGGTLAPGQVVRLALYWRVDALPADPPAQGYSFANHVVATDDQRYGQQDGPGQRLGLWRTGDTIISWFDIALQAEAPEPPYRLRTGMYTFVPPDQFTTVPLVDREDEPTATTTDWQLVSP